MTFRSTFLVTALSLALALPACLAAAENIKIGVAGAHSGDLASYGLPTVKAAELVAGDINARGGINGRQLELLIEDDACKPEIATNTATKLISMGVKVVIGHICSGATKAALPIYKEAGVIVISPSATNTELTLSGDYPNFYRTIFSDNVQARTIVDFTINDLAAKKIAILHDKGDYGKGLAEFAKTYVEEDESVELALYEGVTPGAVDYSAVVQKIKRSGADAVIYGGYHPEASKIVTQMRRKKMTIPFVSDDGVKDDTFIKIAGEYAEGVYATGPIDVTANPIGKAAREAHRREYGSEPGAFFDNAYTAALALTNALIKAGGTESEAVARVLRTEDVATPFGALHFDDQGDTTGATLAIYRVVNGRYVPIR
ncbi:MAG: branched-chain amino acid ABC transporter substrate-binding protein [Desulfobulbus sp.]|jgi:branched-chain amino acid transport system substrate-binding protein|nr:MAG: branched-chain amino acid ABC transporter substrate-binding protein [Desulfobulbus sp.]